MSSIQNLINQMEYDRRQAREYIQDCLSVVIGRALDGTPSPVDFFVLGECNAQAKTYGWLKTRRSIERLGAMMSDEDVSKESLVNAHHQVLKNLSGENQ